MKYSTALLLGAAATVNAAGWNYLKHGADWPKECTDPGVKRQTPINLVSPGADGFSYPLIEDVNDDTHYNNYQKRQVTWNGHTSQVNLVPGTSQDREDIAQYNKEIPDSYFMSSIPMRFYDAKHPLIFEAQQFHFHAPSEHTIDGEYMDLEMHTVHYPTTGVSQQEMLGDEPYIAAALGINFSVSKHNANATDAEVMVIDNFFDSLRWDDDSSSEPTFVNNVAYGNLVNMVNFHERWVYSGSVTTPPCAQKVFWNELSTIYPLKQRHLDQFKVQLDRPYTDKKTGKANSSVYKEKALSEVGNYRMIYPVDDHKVMYVTQSGTTLNASPETAASERQKDRDLMYMSIAFLCVLLALMLAMCIYSVVAGQYCNPKKAELAEKEGGQKDNVIEMQSSNSDRLVNLSKDEAKI